MRLIGITGGVATGKSLVARLFAQLGAEVLSADEVARELTAPHAPALERIGSELGRRFVRDGVLDRVALGDHVFAQPEARRKLEAILHPLILARLSERIEALRNRKPPPEVVVVEVPLLFEAGVEGWFDEVVVVTASEDTQVRRIRDRDGLDEGAARARIAAQMPLADKVARAGRVIVNDGDMGQLRACVRAAMVLGRPSSRARP
jgi:dephospho-CoA kinase